MTVIWTSIQKTSFDVAPVWEFCQMGREMDYGCEMRRDGPEGGRDENSRFGRWDLRFLVYLE
jgi:hypothetical protein